MVLFPSYNLKIENYMEAFDLLTLDLNSDAMLQDGKVLGTHLAR